MEIRNKKATRDHQILEIIEAGIMLIGAEVKSIKNGRGDLNTAHVRIKDNEVWLINSNIPSYQSSVSNGFDPMRTRKLLLNKQEISSLASKIGQNKLTLIPLSLYTRGRLVKAKIALAKSTRVYEKRDIKKKKDLERDTQRELKDQNRF